MGRAWQWVAARGAAAVAVLTCAVALLAAAGGSQSAAAATTANPQSAVMILLDTNYSLVSVSAEVRSAALAYAQALPPGVRAGLIAFSNASWQTLVRPTTNRAELAAAIARCKAAQHNSAGFLSSTGVYDALAGATSLLRGAAPSRIVVLTDAENLDGPVPTATIPTDIIWWRLDGDDYVGKMRDLASASGGRYVPPAAAAGLAASSFPVPTPSPSPTTAPRAATAARLPASSPWSLTGGLAAIFAALFLLVFALLSSMARKRVARDLSAQIQRYGPQHKPTAAEKPVPETGKTGGVAVSMASRLMPPTAHDRLSKRLELAGVGRPPGEWALLGVGAALVSAVLLSLITSYVLIGVLAGAVIGWLVMRISLSLLIIRRRATFADQLPDILQLIASSLQAGFALPQAFDAVVREDNQPASGEFARALAEARLGANIEDALEAAANRMESDDLRWTVMAIRIQQGTGGNLAEVLLTIVATIRERGFLRRQAQALSAEGRLSAYILVAMPILLGIWLFISSPDYMRPLYTTSIGELLLASAALLLVAGAFIMRQMIKVEV